MLIPQLSMGGAERSFANVAAALSERHRVTCVIFDDNSPVENDTSTEVVSLQVGRGSGWFGKIHAFYRRFTALKKIVEDQQADVVISYLDGANWLNALLPRKYKRIISQRGSVFEDITVQPRYARMRMLALKYLCGRASVAVVLNEDIKKELEGIFPSSLPVKVIPNFFNRDRIIGLANQSRPLQMEKDSRFKLIVVGRLGPEKGFSHVIRVMAALNRRSNGGFALYVVGEGGEGDALQDLAEELGLRVSNGGNDLYDVCFAGKQQNPFPWVSGSDALIISSSAEGGPNILIESMICRTLVVSANCPGPPRFRLAPGSDIPVGHPSPVMGENGILMPNFQQNDYNQTIDEWVEILIEIRDQRGMTERMISNAFNFTENFTREKVFDKWLEIVEQ